MRVVSFTTVLLVASILGLTTGCVSIPDREWSAELGVDDVGVASSMMILETSQEGPFFRNARFEETKQWLEADGDPGDPIFVFVNGWHHNAQPDDRNLASFREFLAIVERRLGGPVKGIYAGWRGDAYDILGIPFEPVDFLSIWDRHRAARKVGEGGLRELTRYLRARHGERDVIMLGHSLGGLALFSALREDVHETVHDRFEYILLNPAVGESEFADLKLEVEAIARPLQLRMASMAGAGRADELPAKEVEMLARLNRKIVVFQALADRAIAFFYRIAFRDNPVGFNQSNATHDAFACGKDTDGAADAACRNSGWPAVCRTALGDPEAPLVLTARGSPSPAECRASFERPVWIVRGANGTSRGHNDILNGLHGDALATLIRDRVRAVRPLRDAK